MEKTQRSRRVASLALIGALVFGGGMTAASSATAAPVVESSSVQVAPAAKSMPPKVKSVFCRYVKQPVPFHCWFLPRTPSGGYMTGCAPTYRWECS